jgi:hypothetical protein
MNNATTTAPTTSAGVDPLCLPWRRTCSRDTLTHPQTVPGRTRGLILKVPPGTAVFTLALWGTRPGELSSP